MPVPNIFSNGAVIDADDVNEDFEYCTDAIAAIPVPPFSTSQIAQNSCDFIINRVLTVAELVLAVSTPIYLGSIPCDVTGGDNYWLQSVSVMPVLAALRTTSMIFSVQKGTPDGAGTWANLVTGITVPIASGGGKIVSYTASAAANTNTQADGRAGLRLLVSQQGVGYAGTDFVSVTLKFRSVLKAVS